MVSKILPPAVQERRQTDASLDDERGKTDDSFENYREKTEARTDRAVSANRLESDRARLKMRAKNDGNHEGNPASSQLKTNRRSEDAAIEKERKNDDRAIALERNEAERLLAEIVCTEREATDKNLLSERTKADRDAEKSAKNLQSAQNELTTRTEFLAIVSHDLRNPMSAIVSAAEMLSETSSVINFGENAVRCIGIIRRNAESALRLIGDILDMERVVEGKVTLRLATCRSGDLINEAIESFTHQAETKDIQIEKATGQIDCDVICDKDRIAQVLSNLIGNALKFTPAGGLVRISAIVSGEKLQISVQDSGPGIPKDQRKKIFERFVQISDTNHGGLGLGLYIAKHFVELHSGKIWATSESGKGSVFHFTLNLVGPAA